jgi:hypothetical protein
LAEVTILFIQLGAKCANILHVKRIDNRRRKGFINVLRFNNARICISNNITKLLSKLNSRQIGQNTVGIRPAIFA